MKQPFIDVIVTNCNLHDYVQAAVASALDQDDVWTRVILVDDASDSPLPEGAWPQDRVHIIRRAQRGGQSAAINTGLGACEADFVALLDADDLFPSFRCALLHQALTGQRADIAFGGQVVFNDGTQPLLRLSAQELAALDPVPPAALPGTTMVRRAVFDRYGLIPQDRMLATFIEWLAVARVSPEPPVEVEVPSPVLLRRSHRDNLTRRMSSHYGDYLTAVARRRAASRP